MSWLQGISQAFGAAAASANTQSLRDGVTVTISTRHPTAEQLADAVIAELKLSNTDLTAYREANNGVDFRDQLIADIKRDGIDYQAMQYLGNGKYAARVGMSAENKRNLIEWSKRDGDGYAPAPRELTAKHAEVRVQGEMMRHKLEVQLRKQEALQQAAQDTGLAGAVTLAAQRTPQALKDVAAQLPKVAPLASELLPPVIATGIVAGGVAIGLDKQLELMVERQMAMVKAAPVPIATSNTADDAPPVKTAERPAPPDIKVAPEGGELVKPDAAPPTTTTSKPPTHAKSIPNAPTGQPSTPQGEPPQFDPSRLVPPAIGITTATLGVEITTMTQPSRTLPSMPPDPTRQPGGVPVRINPNESPENIRSLTRQNESGKLLSQTGYATDYLRESHKFGKPQPDFKIEGNNFDHYAPNQANARNIADVLQKKINRTQASRFVLNLDDSLISVNDLRKQLSTWKIEGLEEIIIVKNGQVLPFFPSEK